MKKQNSQRLQWVLLAVIAGIFLLSANVKADAQGKLGAKYGSRDPRVCEKTPSPGKVPTAAEAVASIICNGEHERGNESLFLLEDVKVTQIGKGSPYKPGVDFNVDDLDPKFLIYPIRGSFKKYQCGQPDLFEPGKSCHLYDEANAQGRCYKDTFGEWQCSMDDKTVGFNDYTEVAPPGGAVKQTDTTKKPAINNQTDKTAETATKKVEAENKGDGEYPKPDFSAMEQSYEIVKYEYAPLEGLLYVYVKPKVELNQRELRFQVKFLDKDGTPVFGGGYPLSSAYIYDAKVGDVVKMSVTIPNETNMKKAVSAVIFKTKD